MLKIKLKINNGSHKDQNLNSFEKRLLHVLE